MIVRTDSLSEIEFKEAYTRAATFWGVETPSSFGQETEEVTLDMLHSRFETAPNTAEFYYVPTRFSLTGDFSFFPVRWDTPWHSLERTLDVHKPPAAMSLLPATFSMGPMFLQACKHRAIMVPATTGNMPLTLEVLRQIGPGVVLVATPKDIQAFLAQSSLQAALSIRAWHVVVDVADETPVMIGNAIIQRDLHLMPGVSIAWQCPQLGADNNNVFHPSPAFTWHEEGNTVRVTSIDTRHTPLFRFRACRGTLTKALCKCGQEYRLHVYAR